MSNDGVMYNAFSHFRLGLCCIQNRLQFESHAHAATNLKFAQQECLQTMQRKAFILGVVLMNGLLVFSPHGTSQC